MDNFLIKDKWSLVTGASAGIGAAFARALAERGSHVVLVARREAQLQTLASELNSKYGVKTEVVALDLSEAQARVKLQQTLKQRGIPISTLVNNAGVGTFGKVGEVDPDKAQAMLELNVVALSNLSQLFLSDMLAAKCGWIFNLASTAAFQPLPYMANYAASKAFVLSFSESLAAEYRGDGIRVLVVCPGVTSTEFFGVMGTKMPKTFVETPEGVVKTAIQAMIRGKTSVVCGHWTNAATAFMSRLLPRAFSARMSAGVVKKLFVKQS